ncbi:MAG: FHA domain-containing protein [Sandaracinaceae bacterium]|nr:FHA domain-containing protein [Sandaracinaceae bacterium]
MATDQNKKTLRSFQCRDYLYEIFEQMSGELECSVDYLINESMRQYARSRNYGVRGPSASVQRPSIPSMGAPVAAPAAAPPLPPMLPTQPTLPDPVAPVHAPLPVVAPLPTAPAALPAAPFVPPLPAAPIAARPSVPPLPAAQPRLPSVPPPAPSKPALFIIFNGQKYPVNKDEFVLGRSAKSADLAIKDGNISRRHAAVVYHGGVYYMKDLGSTNGIDFQGGKIDSRAIQEGDVYQICDYDLRFTYQ